MGYTVSTKTRKWTKKVVEYMLDVSRVNAQTIFCLNNGMNPRKYDSAEFSKQLAMALILPHMAKRRTKQGIQSSVLKKMYLYLQTDGVLHSAIVCYFCAK